MLCEIQNGIPVVVVQTVTTCTCGSRINSSLKGCPDRLMIVSLELRWIHNVFIFVFVFFPFGSNLGVYIRLSGYLLCFVFFPFYLLLYVSAQAILKVL